MYHAWLHKRLPIIGFMLIYVFTCYFGAMVLLFGPESFWSWYHFFSGAVMPDIYAKELVYILLLLNIAPILMWLGYELGLVAINKWKTKSFDIGHLHEENIGKYIKYIFILTSVIGIISVLRTNSLDNLDSWLNYNNWIHTRWQIFNTLNFFEFVNIYMLIPTFGSLFVLNTRESDRKWATILVIVLMMIMGVLLFQKKALVVSILLFFFIMYSYYYGGNNPRKSIDKKVYAVALVICFFIYILYVALVLMPVVLKTSESYKPKVTSSIDGENIVLPGNDVPGNVKENTKPFKTFDVAAKINWESREKSLVFYTLMAPLTRTSSPAMVYPCVFPDEKEYYTLDLGQDILGFGSMPDDNYVIWSKLWPDTPGGAVAAPFHFVLYSQGGLIVAFLGSLVIGLFIAIGWGIINRIEKPNLLLSATGSLIIMFSIYLSIDSFRNSVIVSYGIFWPLISLCFLFFISKFVQIIKTWKIFVSHKIKREKHFNN